MKGLSAKFIHSKERINRKFESLKCYTAQLEPLAYLRLGMCPRNFWTWMAGMLFQDPYRFCVAALGQRRLFHNLPPRGVDEISRRFHQAQLPRADNAAGASAQDEVDGEDIGMAEQLVLFDAAGLAFSRPLLRPVLAPGDAVHVEGM